MKIILLAVAVAATITTAHAGWLTSAAMNAATTSKTVKPTSVYLLDVTGIDVRIYEWQPKGNTHIRCVLVAGSKNSTGVACYKAED